MEPPLIDTGWTELDTQGFSSLIGPIFFRSEDVGRGVFRLETRETHGNRSGSVHGGVIMIYADIVAANMLRFASGKSRFTTVEMNVHFLRPAQLGRPLICECELLKRGRRLAFVNARFISNQKLVATASSIWNVGS